MDVELCGSMLEGDEGMNKDIDLVDKVILYVCIAIGGFGLCFIMFGKLLMWLGDKV